MRKAGLALQSPVRCVSGCFSSHSEFKSHLLPAPTLPPAPARLQSGAVSGGPEGEARAGEGGLWPSSTCQPHGSPVLGHWEGLASSKPPTCRDSAPPQWVCGFPGKHTGAGLLVGDMPRVVFVQTFSSHQHEAQPCSGGGEGSL